MRETPGEELRRVNFPTNEPPPLLLPLPDPQLPAPADELAAWVAIQPLPPLQEKGPTKEKRVAPQKEEPPLLSREKGSKLKELQVLWVLRCFGEGILRGCFKTSTCFLLQHPYCFQSHKLPPSPAFALSTKTAAHREWKQLNTLKQAELQLAW